MRNKLFKRSISVGFILVFAASFVSYSVLSYIPPSFVQHELAYSIEHCPSHQTEPTVMLVTHFLEDGNQKEGNQKHCVCYSCNLKRHQFIQTEEIITPVTEEFVLYRSEFTEPAYASFHLKELSGRSPPAFSVFS